MEEDEDQFTDEGGGADESMVLQTSYLENLSTAAHNATAAPSSQYSSHAPNNLSNVVIPHPSSHPLDLSMQASDIVQLADNDPAIQQLEEIHDGFIEVPFDHSFSEGNLMSPEPTMRDFFPSTAGPSRSSLLIEDVTESIDQPKANSSRFIDLTRFKFSRFDLGIPLDLSYKTKNSARSMIPSEVAVALIKKPKKDVSESLKIECLENKQKRPNDKVSSEVST